MRDEELRVKIESIFKSLNLQYELIDLEDDDLNYIITIDLKKYVSNIQAPIKMFLYLQNTEYRLNTSSFRIYTLGKEDDELKYLQMLNKTNNELMFGKALLSEDKTITYYYDISLECGWDSLDEKLIDEHIKYFIFSILKILDNIRDMKNEK